jgi:phenylpropionate dioxygenase-like ring-hydroxylating dioxygenase large terminal subunit
MCEQVEQGLVWIWPESGADAWLEASAKPPVTTPEMVDPAFAGAEADFAFMENPASLQVMLVCYHPPELPYRHVGRCSTL